jgi:hypothetical protein
MRRVFFIAAALMILLWQGAQAQWANQEAQFSAMIDCDQWHQNDDGSWDTGPDARLPGIRASNAKRITLKKIYVNGIDVAELLEKKCGHLPSAPSNSK